ncbi:MAG: hypothetical protein HFG80_09815 [Eubacterium sp.]|nr:hypothetical protein [Eubacterium sp.]
MKRKSIVIVLMSIFIFTLNGCTNSDNLNKQISDVQEELNRQADALQAEIDKQTNEIQKEIDKQDSELLNEMQEESNNEINQSLSENDTDSVIQEEISVESEIETAIRDHITDQYSNTDIDSITINENLGTDAEGDYIALVYLTWNVKNTAKTSKEVLELYSNDLAATLAESCPSIQELAIFWTVPYLNDASAKCSYERKDGAMYTMDDAWVGFN